MRFQRIGKNHKSVVNRDQHQGDGDSNTGFSSMRTNAQGNTDQSKGKACIRECQLTVHLDLDRRYGIEGFFEILLKLRPQVLNLK